MNCKYCLLSLLWFAFANSSCKKLVDVDAPSNKLVTTSVFSSDITAIAAQLGVYSQMQSVPWSFAYYSALSSDEFINYSTNQNARDLYLNALSANKDGGLIWGPAYKYIYQENAIIENAQNSSGISSRVKGLLIGEAQFTRAFWYFYLVNYYGDVPLITTTDYKINSLMSRTAMTSVYEQIIKDLKSAENSLSSSYLDATDTLTTSDRVRPTKWAASALLARVYLYGGKYDSAELEASNVINNSNLYGLTNLDSVFLANSREAIWQIPPPSSYLCTYEGNYFILSVPPGGSGMNNSCAISSQLLGAFEPGDNRRAKWINSYTNGSKTWFYPYKYKDNSLTATQLNEYSMVLRLGEQYLIRAEARAQQNKINDAINDINLIRSRAGLSGLTNVSNQSQVLSAVAHERQLELFTEGQRWLDLKRTSTVDVVMNIVTSQKGGTWNTNQQLYPLSLSDIKNGINLVQNTGY